MNRIAFAVVLIAMVIVVGTFLNSMKTKELCPDSYSYIDGKCCIDKDKNNVCDINEPVKEEPGVVEEKTVAASVRQLEDGSRLYTVDLKDVRFYPSELNISVGDTVIWVNKEEKTPHMVFGIFNIFRSPKLEPGDSYNFTFERPGEYECSDAIFTRMKGKITVEEKPVDITGSVVKVSDAKIRVVTSIILIIILVTINMLIYKKGRNKNG